MRKLYIFGLIALASLIIGLAWAEQITLTTYYPAPFGVYEEMVVMDSLALSSATKYGDTVLSIYGTDGNDDAVFTAALEDGAGNNPVFSILPWDTQVFLSAGVYYNNGTWIHYSNDLFSQLFVLDPASGARWYASSNNSASWNLANDVQLWTDAGVWTGASSHDLKENFTPVDSNDILQRISQLEITRWNFKAEDDSVTHIGPVAEDFYRVFRTGDSKKSLPTIDSVGVALAGVKGLLKKTESQQNQIARLQQEIKEIKLLIKNRK